jgi:hypothetical protein
VKCSIEHRLKLLESKIKKIDEIESKFADFMQNSRLNGEKKPFKCPVCCGYSKIQITHGIMEPFEKRIRDSAGRHFILCNTCEGKGIIWG